MMLYSMFVYLLMTLTTNLLEELVCRMELKKCSLLCKKDEKCKYNLRWKTRLMHLLHWLITQKLERFMISMYSIALGDEYKWNDN